MGSQTIKNKKRKKRSRQVKYLTAEQRDRLLAVITDPRDRAIFTLTVYRGLRASEVGLLRMEDLDLRTWRLYVRRLKGSRSQDFLLLPPEQAALKSWLRVRGKGAGLLFTGYRGRGLGRRQLDRLVKRYCAAAGIPDRLAHCHALKHTAGTWLASDCGETVQIVRDWLGHEDIRSTMVYVEVTPAARQAAAERVARRA